MVRGAETSQHCCNSDIREESLGKTRVKIRNIVEKSVAGLETRRILVPPIDIEKLKRQVPLGRKKRYARLRLKYQLTVKRK